jgi:hypothetical protein
VRNYQLYLIVDEFASHYFGRERMFFQLFQEHEEAVGDFKSILEEQIHFITKPIQVLKIHQIFGQYQQRVRTLYAKSGTYYIEIGSRSYAKLEIHERFINIKSNGDYEAETVFFEILRKVESSFLAIDFENSLCSWLKPIKERKFVY